MPAVTSPSTVDGTDVGICLSSASVVVPWIIDHRTRPRRRCSSTGGGTRWQSTTSCFSTSGKRLLFRVQTLLFRVLGPAGFLMDLLLEKMLSPTTRRERPQAGDPIVACVRSADGRALTS